MIEFVSGKSGHPWHGLWKQTTNKITTPAGGDIALPGSEPSGVIAAEWIEHGYQNIPVGYVYKFSIPGLAAVTTSPSEAAAGMTWTNYAVISGFSRQLYGKSIQPNTHLYAAPDGTVWSCRVTPSGDFATKKMRASVSFRRFGQIGESGSAPMYSMAQRVINLNIRSDVSGDYFQIEDISSDGSRILIAGYGYTHNGDMHKRWCHSIGEVVIAGVPPAATVTLTQVAGDLAGPHSSLVSTSSHKYLEYATNVAGDYEVINTFYDISDSLTPANPTHRYLIMPVSESLEIDDEELIGARYDAADNVQVMKVVRLYSMTMSGTLSPAGMSQGKNGLTPRGAISGSRTASGHISLMANATELFRIPISLTASTSGYINNVSDMEDPPSNDTTETLAWTFGDESSSSTVQTQGGGVPNFPALTQIRRVYGWRYSNTLFGLIGMWSLMPFAEPIFQYPVSGRYSSVATTHKVTNTWPAHWYGSESPDGSHIELSVTPVCYV